MADSTRLASLLFLFSFICTVAAKLPPSCNKIECPNYSVIEEGNGYEIRRYNSAVWMSTSQIQDISFTNATRSGFLQLFNYISGKNEEKKKIEMTAPVLTEILPSDGPFCKSSFTVSFYVPKANQANPPAAAGLKEVKWTATHVAVKQFGGFVDEYDIAKEAAALKASLSGTKWEAMIERRRGKSEYVVAQYNAPFEYKDRTNEIWLTFALSDVYAIW